MLKIFTLENKTVLVAGTFNELSKAIGCALVVAGASVIITDKVSKEALKYSERLHNMGYSIEFVESDITKSKDVKSLMWKVFEKYGKIDILVNACNESRDAMITEISDSDWQETLNTCLTSAFYCCREVIPYMLESRRGRIINVSSVAGMRGLSHNGVHYCAASSGLMSLSRQLTLQYTHLGICINSVAPGYIDVGDASKGNDEDKMQLAIEKSPLKRLGKPEDVASAVLFLASEASSYLAGETIHVNGGLFMI